MIGKFSPFSLHAFEPCRERGGEKANHDLGCPLLMLFTDPMLCIIRLYPRK
jgi:hypothetical protein